MAPARRGGGAPGRRPRGRSGCAHPGSPRRRPARSPPGRRRGAGTPRGARSTPAGDCDRRTAMGDPLAALAARVAAAPYCARLGVVVEAITLDRARIRVPYKDENSNPGRALHGGVPASTIDVAGVLAAATGLAGRPTFDAGTLDLSVDYLAAAIGEDIVAEAEVLRRGKEIVYADVDVRNDGGKRIAKGLVTYRALDRPPAGAERPRVTRAEPAAAGGEGPKPARAPRSGPFMASLGLAITHMHDGQAVIRMPLTPDKTDHEGAIHEGALAALLDTTGAMASWSIAGLDLRYKASTVGIHVSYHGPAREDRSEEHTSELQSRLHLVCRLLLEKKKKNKRKMYKLTRRA